MNDPVEWAKQMAAMVKGHVGAVVEKMNARFADLETRIASIPAGKDGTNGVNGKDGADGVGIAGKDGRDGTDGKDGTSVTVEQILPPLVETIAKVAQESAQRAVAELPRPQDGKSVTVDDVRPLIADAVAKVAQSYERDRAEFFETLSKGLASLERA